MPIAKRFAKKAKVAKKGNIVRRTFAGVQKSFADNVEEYVFNLPKEPIPFVELVFTWQIPYQEGHFVLYGQKLKLSPRYRPTDNNMVIVTGVLCELVHQSRPKRQIVDGSRGTWHGKIKFFVKSTMAELS